MELKAAEQGFASKIIALDFLRLRRFTPRFIIKPIYKKAFETVNKRTESETGRGEDITVEDFHVGGDDPDKGLDLIGVCVK